jgi:hypothetical protein
MKAVFRFVFLALFAVRAFAAGSVTQSFTKLGLTDIWVLDFDWTGDASNGSVPNTNAALTGGNYQGWMLLGAEFMPLSPAPTTLYDVQIIDGMGVDFLQGGGIDLSATVASSATVGPNAPPLNGTFTLKVSGNSAAGAKGRVLVYLAPPNVAAKYGMFGLVNLARLSPSGATVGQAIVLGADGKWAPGAGGGGGGGAPTNATYITQTPNATLTNEQPLSALASGCLASEYLTGIVSSRTLTGTPNQITVTNGDCSGNPTISIPTNPIIPGTISSTFSGNLTGNASTATAFQTNPADCSSNQYATTISATGDLTCSQVAYSQLSGTPTIYYQTVQNAGSALTQRSTINFTGSGITCVDNAGSSRTDCTVTGGGGGSSAFSSLTSGTNTTAAMIVGTGASLSVTGSGTIAATTAAALATNPADCTSGQYANAIAENGDLTCAQVAYSQISGTPTNPIGYVYSAQNTSFTATSNTAYFITGSSVVITLPAAPANNDYVVLVNGSTVSGCSVNRNGKTINGSATNLNINQANFQIKLVYYSATNDWRLAL